MDDKRCPDCGIDHQPNDYHAGDEMETSTNTSSLIIEDPLAWQQNVDDTGLLLNGRGADRFWATVSQRLGGIYIGRDGAPETTEIVMEIQPGVGVRIYTSELLGDEGAGLVPNLRFEFVELVDGG